jgi:hypothetical protein
MPSLTTRRLTTGVVGYGYGSMEAFRNAISEWGGLFAQAIVGSCLKQTGVTKRDCLRIGHHRIRPGGKNFAEQLLIQFHQDGNGSNMQDY